MITKTGDLWRWGPPIFVLLIRKRISFVGVVTFMGNWDWVALQSFSGSIQTMWARFKS